MAMGSLDMTSVTLIPDQLILSQELDMSIFRITYWNLGRKTFKKDKNGLRMVFVMKRKITSEMMTTYFPTILLIAITFATTFFKPEYFEASLTVNLTNMLVMTTLFTSKMDQLPPTSDTKMIDIWLIFCLLVPFAFTLVQTAIEGYREEDSSNEKWAEARIIDDIKPEKKLAEIENLGEEVANQKAVGMMRTLQWTGSHHHSDQTYLSTFI